MGTAIAATDTTDLSTESLSDLAAGINTEHRACSDAMQKGLRHALNAGAMLLEAKGRLNHGEWLPWLRENTELPERTARLYMQVACNRDHLLKTATVADLTLRGAQRLLATPQDPEEEPEPSEPGIDQWLRREGESASVAEAFAQIRDQELRREAGQESFLDCVKERWGERTLHASKWVPVPSDEALVPRDGFAFLGWKGPFTAWVVPYESPVLGFYFVTVSYNPG